MKFFLISDNVDTQMGMRMAGIEGVVAHEPAEVERYLRQAIADEDVGILLITEGLAQQCDSLLYPLKTSVSRPLIVEIPDRHGVRSKDSITRYVRDAIGVKF